MSFRLAITGHGEVSARELCAHPANVRTHGLDQQADMGDVLDAVGWVKTVLVNQRTGRILDGHMRTALAAARGELVPVRYCDLSEADEALVLMAFDASAQMADTDAAKLADLLGDIGEHKTLGDYLDRLAAESGVEYADPPKPPEVPTTPPVVFAVGSLAWDVTADQYAEWIGKLAAVGNSEQIVSELLNRLGLTL